MIWIAGWLACSVLGYLVDRADHRQAGCGWTVGRRLGAICASIAFGPLFCLLGFSAWLFCVIDDLDWDKPAKW